MTRGHVFVVHGRMEHLGWDAVIVPTDEFFTVERYWDPLWPGRHARELRPEGWGRGAALRARTGDPTWFVDVAVQELDALVEQVRTVLDQIGRAALAPGTGRARPLVAMPMLGTGAGGFASKRGDVLRRLLETAEAAVANAPFDVVVVAARQSAFAALQSVRRGGAASRNLSPDLEEAASALGQQARRGGLALFLGAGVSIGSGLPSWSDLLRGLAGEEPLGDLGPLEQAQLVAKRLTPDAGTPEEAARIFGERVVAELRADEAEPSLTHALLAGLEAREAVTTNYDRLYEKAVAASKGTTLEAAIDVLPWARATPERPWVLKMHGDIEHPESIVLTRSDFVRYDAVWRPVGAVVQHLMLSRHLLVVGASLSDDNLLRIAHQVMEFRRNHLSEQPAAPIGTVLTLGHRPAARQLWAGELDHVSVSDIEVPDAKKDPIGRATALAQTSRDLAIFLDRVAVHASSDASYLLDATYAGLLAEDERALAAELRAVFARVQSMASKKDAWGAVSDALAGLGAHRPKGDEPTKTAASSPPRSLP